MKRVRAFSAMVFVFCVLVIFLYSSLHLEPAYTITSTAEGSQKLRRLHAPQGQVKSTPEHTRFTTAETSEAVFQTVSVSKDLREMIPKNEAYWNRLMHTALKSLDSADFSFRRESPWSVCRVENQELLQLNIHDFNSYPPLLQTFVRGMTCKSPPILIDQPNKCIAINKKEYNQTFLLLAIKSSPRNFEQRQTVRETWGREGVHHGGLTVRTFFLLGSSTPDDPDMSALLSYEAERFGDILQWDFHESFLNLTLKMKVFLQWTLKNCPQVSFIFSGDDDVFVNTPGLLNYLKSLDASKAESLYVGHVISTASPLRDPKSKYYIPMSFYNGAYPAYAGGGGFIFSGGLLQPLYSVSQVLPFYPIDDVYFGMCAKALGISAVAHEGFQTFDIKEQDRSNVCVHKHLMLVHQRSPQQTKKLWRGIHSPMLTC
ncbi:hypothetical protein OJAV_G00132930 [Oryzias javanicus]|uniref:Hexosyltransferase n=1 Tax=Oryzias javanicus TaxID=123683 RepID=A0A3S2MRI8_ORYJA|nr:hypothetical protein OJAV_G00132930 [Oryzias javanicus]